MRRYKVKKDVKPHAKGGKLRRIYLGLCCAVILAMLALTFCNVFMAMHSESSIASDPTDITADCIIVLGAKVSGSELSTVLADRVDRAIELYNGGCASKIIMSGDHGTAEYDEVNAMKAYAVANGVDSDDIYLDHAGFSTYESLYRAKEIFGVQKAIIVTQRYHLYRAIYLSDSLGLDAVGVAADAHPYRMKNELRELLARPYAIVQAIIKPEPTYLGEKIDMTQPASVTDDKEY